MNIFVFPKKNINEPVLGDADILPLLLPANVMKLEAASLAVQDPVSDPPGDIGSRNAAGLTLQRLVPTLENPS